MHCALCQWWINSSRAQKLPLFKPSSSPRLLDHGPLWKRLKFGPCLRQWNGVTAGARRGASGSWHWPLHAVGLSWLWINQPGCLKAGVGLWVWGCCRGSGAQPGAGQEPPIVSGGGVSWRLPTSTSPVLTGGLQRALRWAGASRRHHTQGGRTPRQLDTSFSFTSTPATQGYQAALGPRPRGAGGAGPACPAAGRGGAGFRPRGRPLAAAAALRSRSHLPGGAAARAARGGRAVRAGGSGPSRRGPGRQRNPYLAGQRKPRQPGARYTLS